MAVTYQLVDPINNPVAQVALDTAVATAPADRPSVFTPPGGYVAPSVASDYAIGTVASKRPMCFEAPSVSVTVDPGLVTNG